MNHPNTEPVGDTAYRLEETYWVNVGAYAVYVPKGYVYDGASVPQFCWSFGFRPDGLWRAAALIHDWLYEHGGVVNACWYDNGRMRDEKIRFSRRDADGVFLLLMKEAGVKMWKRQFMFRMVRMWGWMFWGKPSRLAKLRD